MLSAQTTEFRRFVLLASAGLAAGWVVLVVVGPILASISQAAAGLLYLVGSLVCHQQPERSFHLAGAQLPVCARCLGLYAGAAAGLTIWTAVAPIRGLRWTRPRAVISLAISGAPTAATVASAWLGTGDPSNAWRAALALPLGAAAGLIAGAVTTNHLQ